jgi:preprotein translocase subunit SecG
VIHFITVVHVAVCVLLVLVVLLQQGKKDGMGTAFGGGSSSVFGARGAETFLEKLTKVLAVVFMCSSLSLVYLSSRETTNSIFSTEKTTTPTPVTTPAASTPIPPPAPDATAKTEIPASSTVKPAEKSVPTAPAPVK